MTIQTAIVRRAMRMLNLVGVGASLDPDEADEALVAFQSMMLSLPGLGLGDQLEPVLISANYTAGENESITDSSGSAVITLPPTIAAEDSETGEERAPLNGAIVQINSATVATVYVYVAYLKGWKQLTGLTLAGESPLGPAHDEGLAAMLAERIAGPNTAIPSNVVLMAEKGQRDIYLRFEQDATTELDRAFQGRTRRVRREVF